MMLFKLSIKNIKKSIKDYAIYFFTLILGVAVFYVFNAIESQTVMLNVSKNTSEIIKLMNTMLSGVSVFVSVILGSLIIYASRFLIKRRNKEFGIYLTLGMSKRKMSLILFFETLLIGIISLIVGLILGIIFSQFMSIIVANIFTADMTKFTFTFSKISCLKTIIYFSMMYILVMIFNTVQVRRSKLIDLLYSYKKSEKLKLKNPFLCIIIFIISCILLGIQYYKVTKGYNAITSEREFIQIIIIGSISTFLIFWSLSGLLIKIFTSLKNTYYKGLNSFILRQFSSKVNTSVISISVICLMLFITICLLSSSFTLAWSMNKNLEILAPADIEMSKNWHLQSDELIDTAIIEDSNVDISTTLKNNNFDIDKSFSKYVEYNIYQYEDFTIKTFLGDKLEEFMKQYKMLKYDTPERIIKVSDYNKIATLLGHDNISLKDDEYVLVADFKNMVEIRNEVLKNNREIVINGFNLKSKYDKCVESSIELSANHINIGLFVVPDNVVDDKGLHSNNMIANYKASDKEGKQKIEEEINTLFDSIYNKTTWMSNNTKIDITESSVGLGAMVTFICLYLGIIFLVSSAAVLALKELSESADNKNRYGILRSIGTDEKIINKALFIQIGITFLFPLLIACIHSYFGLIFANNILEAIGNEELFNSILISSLIILIIYGSYFLITYQSSKIIIKEK